jgi:hypothetical protein
MMRRQEVRARLNEGRLLDTPLLDTPTRVDTSTWKCLFLLTAKLGARWGVAFAVGTRLVLSSLLPR